MKWVLIIVVTTWYAAATDRIEFSSKEECFEALSRVKLDAGTSGVAYCKPGESK